MPHRCPLAPENEEFEDEVRQHLYGKRDNKYRILFSIMDAEVQILHIRHGKRRRLKSDAE